MFDKRLQLRIILKSHTVTVFYLVIDISDQRLESPSINLLASLLCPLVLITTVSLQCNLQVCLCFILFCLCVYAWKAILSLVIFSEVYIGRSFVSKGGLWVSFLSCLLWNQNPQFVTESSVTSHLPPTVAHGDVTNEEL